MDLEQRIRRAKVEWKVKLVDKIHNFKEGIKDFSYRLPSRTKYSLDYLIENSAYIAVTAYGIDKCLQYIFDWRDEGNILALGVTFLAGVVALGAIFFEVKYHYLWEFLKSRYRKNSDTITRGQKISRWSWAKTVPMFLFTGALTVMLNLDYPILRDRIINPPALRELISEQEREPIPAEYKKIPGLKPAIVAEIYWLTKPEGVRKDLTRQIREFEKNYRQIVETYYQKYLKGTIIDIEDIFGLLSTESNMKQFAISEYGAAGLGQIMPFTAQIYNKECGGSKLFLTNNVKIGNETGDKSYYKKYAVELKNLKAKKPDNQLVKEDSRFDPKVNICMVVRHLRFLIDKYPKDDKNSILVKYNTNDKWVEFAKGIMGSREFEGYAPFFRQKESRDYPFKIDARTVIIKSTPDLIVKEHTHYLKRKPA